MEGNYKLTDANDEFFLTLKKTLRKGDVITQNGKNQFFVMLTNTDAYRDILQVIKRISDNWDKNPACNYYKFEYEWSVIDN